MFNNVGKKLKDLANILFVLSIIGGIGSAIAMFVIEIVWLGFVLLVTIPLLVWIGCLGIYALGQIAEDTELIKNETVKPSEKASTTTAPNNQQQDSATQESAAVSRTQQNPTKTTTKSARIPIVSCPKCQKQIINSSDLDRISCPQCGTVINTKE